MDSQLDYFQLLNNVLQVLDHIDTIQKANGNLIISASQAGANIFMDTTQRKMAFTQGGYVSVYTHFRPFITDVYDLGLLGTKFRNCFLYNSINVQAYGRETLNVNFGAAPYPVVFPHAMPTADYIFNYEILGDHSAIHGFVVEVDESTKTVNGLNIYAYDGNGVPLNMVGNNCDIRWWITFWSV